MSTTQESEFPVPPSNQPGSDSRATQDKPDLDAMAARFGLGESRGEPEGSDETAADETSGRSRVLVVGVGAVVGLAVVAVVVRRVVRKKQAARSLLERVGLLDR